MEHFEEYLPSFFCALCLSCLTSALSGGPLGTGAFTPILSFEMWFLYFLCLLCLVLFSQWTFIQLDQLHLSLLWKLTYELLILLYQTSPCWYHRRYSHNLFIPCQRSILDLHESQTSTKKSTPSPHLSIFCVTNTEQLDITYEFIFIVICLQPNIVIILQNCPYQSFFFPTRNGILYIFSKMCLLKRTICINHIT